VCTNQGTGDQLYFRGRIGGRKADAFDATAMCGGKTSERDHMQTQWEGSGGKRGTGDLGAEAQWPTPTDDRILEGGKRHR